MYGNPPDEPSPPPPPETGGGVYGVVGGVTGVVELFVAVGVGLFTSDAEIELEGESGVLDGDSEGLLLGEPLPVGQGSGVADFVGEALDDPDGSPPLRDALGVPDELAEAEAFAEDDADCDGVAQLVGDPDDAAEAATPAVAGMTSRAPIATVPVATTPATDTADRPPVRTCLGTFQPPAFAACRAFGSGALRFNREARSCPKPRLDPKDHVRRAWAHLPTVTNLGADGHPRSN